MRKDEEPPSVNANLRQKRQVAEAKAARDVLTEQDNALDTPVQKNIGGVEVALRMVERVASAALPAIVVFRCLRRHAISSS
jgi:hypothetical protein